MTEYRSKHGLWHSKISVFQDCARKYKFQFIDEEPITQYATSDMSFGTGMHLALNAALSGENPKNIFDIYWKGEEGKFPKYGRYNHHQLADMGHILIDKFVKYHARFYDPLVMEERMLHQYNTFTTLEGTADFVGIYKGKRSIVDFKTSMYPYNKDSILHSPQMYIYASLAEKLHSFRAEQLVYVVLQKQQPKIQCITLELTKDRLDAMMDTVLDTCYRIKTEEAWLPNHKSCIIRDNKCTFFDKCWKEK